MSNDIDLQESPEMALAHPGYHWKGLTLSLYRMSAKLALQRITKAGDKYLFTSLALLYILSKPSAEIFRAIDDVDKFRATIYEWADTLNLTEADEEEACDLFDKILNDSKAGKAQIADTGVTDSSGKA